MIDPAEFAALKAMVRDLDDRRAILDVVHSYARGLDRLDTGLAKGAFHADAIDHHGPFVGPAADFIDWIMPIEARLRATFHNVTNHRCDVDGDTAHAESYVTWFTRSPDGAKISVGGGRYVDRLERREGRWAIVLRRATVEWMFDVPVDPEAGTMGYPSGSRDRSDLSYERPLRLPDGGAHG